MSRNTSLCYIERDGQVLMLHRVKKEHDLNRDKWLGVGGGFLENESPEECCIREAFEETGLTLIRPVFRAVVTFVIEGGESEIMFLFTCADFTGDLIECSEGDLEWVPKEDVLSLNLWEGDRIFLRMLEESDRFFTLKLVYDRNDRLTEAIADGSERIL